jgi:hypothetical protein
MSMYYSPEILRAMTEDRLREAREFRRAICPCYDESAPQPSRLSRLFGRRSQPAAR